MAECSYKRNMIISEEVSALNIVPFQYSAAQYIDHTLLELVPTSLYEDYIDELFCTESSSEAGSCCSYTDLFNVGSLNLAFSQLPPASAAPIGHCNLQSSILAWSDATRLPPIVSVHVAGQVFKLHKFPMVSLSGYMKKELMESEEVHLDKGRWWPGGAESFEVAASFCYGGRVALSPTNVAAVRCAAEVLEMSEEYTQGNLARRCDVYLRQVALRRWRHALLVLQQCESLRPLAESLLIVADCVDALATMACGQAVNAIDIYPLDGMHTASLSATNFPAKSCDNISDSPRHCDPLVHTLRHRKGCLIAQNTLSASGCFSCFTLQQLADDQLAWIHDLSELPHYQFSPIILAAHRFGMRGKHIALALLQYAEKSIFSCFEVLKDGALKKKQDIVHAIACSFNKNDGIIMQGEEIIEKIEAMVALLQDALLCNREAERRERFSMIRFLFGLLKCAHACGSGMQANQCKQRLECMIEKRLQHARISDFELPCSLLREAAGEAGGSHCCSRKARVYSEDQQRRRDQKEIESMLHIFTVFFSSRVQCVGAGKYEAEGGREVEQQAAQVAELWDDYMAEAAKEAELTVRMFVEVAEVVPPSARQCHDRLYAAVDSFLQSHPSVSPQERQVACKVLNCQKLSQACCIQAVQNETMPLRIIVQAMFMHQLNTATTTPVLQRSTSCYHQHHHQDANTPNSLKMTHQLGFLLKAETVGKHCQSTMGDATLDDPEALNTRLLTLEDEIQLIKRGLAGFKLINTRPQASPTTSRARGWRSRFPCLNAFLRHASSPRFASRMSKLHQQERQSIHVQPACCLAQPSSNKQLHSF